VGRLDRSAPLQGAKSSWEIVEDAEVWRLLTSMYLHSGLLHVAANMLGLMGYGWRLERDFGALKVAAVWLISGTFAMCVNAHTKCQSCVSRSPPSVEDNASVASDF
jgi:membrane associated rhomboid family serine protease